MKAFIDTVRQSLTANPNPQPMSTDRSYLHEQTSGGSQPFTKAVNTVNANQASHGQDIPADKAKKYAADTAAVESGDLSNASGFASSSVDWARRGNPAAAVMNFGGWMAIGGVADHANYATGGIFGMGGRADAGRGSDIKGSGYGGGTG